MEKDPGIFVKHIKENDSIKEISYETPFYLNKISRNTIHFLAYGETQRKKPAPFLPPSTGKQGKNPGMQKTFPCWMIYENISGSGYLKTAASQYFLQSGDLILLQPLTEAILSPEEGKNLFGRYIYMSDTMVISAMGSALSIKNAGIFHFQREKCADEIFNKIKSLVSDPETCPEAEGWLSRMCYELLYTLSLRKREESSDVKFEKFLRQLSATCTSPHTLQEMAEACGVTPRTLSRLFQAKLSISPMQYLINLRLDYAAMLLCKGDQLCSVKIIAEKCGYRNIPFFCREFRKKFSLSPMQYSKEFRRKITSVL